MSVQIQACWLLGSLALSISSSYIGVLFWSTTGMQNRSLESAKGKIGYEVGNTFRDTVREKKKKTSCTAYNMLAFRDPRFGLPTDHARLPAEFFQLKS